MLNHRLARPGAPPCHSSRCGPSTSRSRAPGRPGTSTNPSPATPRIRAALCDTGRRPGPLGTRREDVRNPFRVVLVSTSTWEPPRRIGIIFERCGSPLLYLREVLLQCWHELILSGSQSPHESRGELLSASCTTEIQRDQRPGRAWGQPRDQATLIVRGPHRAPSLVQLPYCGSADWAGPLPVCDT